MKRVGRQSLVRQSSGGQDLRRPLTGLGRSLAASWLALSLVVEPSVALAAPPGAVPVQDDDVDLDDILMDDDILADDDDEKPKKPAREPEPEPEPDELPPGDGDMPMGDYDLEHGGAPAVEPAPEPKPSRAVVSEPEPEPAPVTSTPVRKPAPSTATGGRTLIADDPSSEPGRAVVSDEEVSRVGSIEPEDSESDGVVWAITGVGAVAGALAVVGLGVGGYFLLGGLGGGATGSVTVSPH